MVVLVSTTWSNFAVLSVLPEKMSLLLAISLLKYLVLRIRFHLLCMDPKCLADRIVSN